MKEKIVTKILTIPDSINERQMYTFMAITIVAAMSWLLSLGIN